MNTDQFNQIVSYVMLTALNTAGIFQQNQRMRSLTVEEIDQLQTELQDTAKKIQAALANNEGWPPSYGRADN